MQAKGFSGKAIADQKNTDLVWPVIVDRPFRLGLDAKFQIQCDHCFPTGRYATAKAEVAVGKLLGSLLVSAGKGDLVLRFGTSDSLMKVISKEMVPKAGWVLSSILGLFAGRMMCMWAILRSSGIANLCPF